jgi:hypothetical protein
MAVNYHQGRFTPVHPEKYAGDVKNIIARSSWERKLFIYLDNNPSVIRWASEEVKIPYMNQVDGRAHRYYPDVVVQFKDKNGVVQNAMIEVKPKAQCSAPKLPASGRQTRRYINEMVTYLTNESKWAAARDWCARNGFQFHLMTEDHLFNGA